MAASKKNQCSQCGKRLSSKSSLNQHMVVHSPERPFDCPNCEANFKRNNNLQRHIRSQHQIKNISSSSIAISKKRNLRAPSNSVPLPSKTVGMKRRIPKKGKGRSQPPTLKANECIMCGAVLKTRKYLTQHIAIHLGELPFDCNFCDMAFKRKSSAVSHMKKHHPNGLIQKGINSPQTGFHRPSPVLDTLRNSEKNGQHKPAMKSESNEITGKESTLATPPKTGAGKLGSVSLCKSTCRAGKIGKAASGNEQKLYLEFSTPIIDFPRTRLRSGREIPRPEEVIQKRKAVLKVMKMQSIPLEEFSKMGDGSANGRASNNSLNQAYQLDKNRVDYKFQSPVKTKTEPEQEGLKRKEVQEKGLFNPPRALKMAKQVTGNGTGVSIGTSKPSSATGLKRTRLERWYKRHPSEVRSIVSPVPPRYVDTYVRNTAFEEQFWTCFFQDVQIFAPGSINPSFNGIYWPSTLGLPISQT